MPNCLIPIPSISNMILLTFIKGRIGKDLFTAVDRKAWLRPRLLLIVELSA